MSQPSYDTLISLCLKANMIPPTREEALADWGLDLNETKAELEELVSERFYEAQESVNYAIQEYNFNQCNI